MTRRILLAAAAAVLGAGLFVAVAVIEPARCGMDDFDCSPNGPRTLTIVVTVATALVLVLLSIPDDGRTERSSAPRPPTAPAGTGE